MFNSAKRFFRKLLGLPPTLTDVATHLDTAKVHLDNHVTSLCAAAGAIADHNTAAYNTIDGLSQAIGQTQARIMDANKQLAQVNAALDKVV